MGKICVSEEFQFENFLLELYNVWVLSDCASVLEVYNRTKYVKPEMADLSLGGLKEEVDEYEATYVPRDQSKLSEWIDRKVFWSDSLLI
jgi:hypothetical protein